MNKLPVAPASVNGSALVRPVVVEPDDAGLVVNGGSVLFFLRFCIYSLCNSERSEESSAACFSTALH